VQQVRQQQSGWSGADDGDLRAHGSSLVHDRAVHA
jgi:hypothetical protein